MYKYTNVHKHIHSSKLLVIMLEDFFPEMIVLKLSVVSIYSPGNAKAFRFA